MRMSAVQAAVHSELFWAKRWAVTSGRKQKLRTIIADMGTHSSFSSLSRCSVEQQQQQQQQPRQLTPCHCIDRSRTGRHRRITKQPRQSSFTAFALISRMPQRRQCQ